MAGEYVGLVDPSLPTTVAEVQPSESDFVYVLAVAVASPLATEGTEDITPKPNAATVTSAMRLKVVFVDICFLSISQS
jgi:hypothetical protein